MSEINILGVKIGNFKEWDQCADWSLQFYNPTNLVDIYTTGIPENIETLFLNYVSSIVTVYLKDNISVDLEIDFEKLAKHKQNIDYAE